MILHEKASSDSAILHEKASSDGILLPEKAGSYFLDNNSKRQ